MKPYDKDIDRFLAEGLEQGALLIIKITLLALLIGLIIFLTIIMVIGILVLLRRKKRKVSESDFDHRKNNQHSKPVKNMVDTDKQTLDSDNESGRQCKVCHSNISHGVKTCPSCGDIYS